MIDFIYKVLFIIINNNGFVFGIFRYSREDGLNKVFGVVFLLEDFDFFLKIGCIWFLVC